MKKSQNCKRKQHYQELKEWLVIIGNLMTGLGTIALVFIKLFHYHHVQSASVLVFATFAPKVKRTKLFYNLHYVKYNYCKNGLMVTVHTIVYTKDIDTYLAKIIPCSFAFAT